MLANPDLISDHSGLTELKDVSSSGVSSDISGECEQTEQTSKPSGTYELYTPADESVVTDPVPTASDAEVSTAVDLTASNAEVSTAVDLGKTSLSLTRLQDHNKKGRFEVTPVLDEDVRTRSQANKSGVSEVSEVSSEVLMTTELPVYSVTIPTSKHNSIDCLEAKHAELERLKEFDVYEEVSDTGQYCISTKWVIVQKGPKVKARLVARGFEEDLASAVDSPTISKPCVRMLLAIAASNQWVIRSTDIKSAFLQGQVLIRDVFLKPPKESNTQQGKNWKLQD